MLILDQSKVSDRHQVLMLALRHGERALPLAWRVETTEGAIGFDTQKALLDAVAPWMPAGAKVCLMGDRFYGTADLISLCQGRGWNYRLRLKGTLTVRDRSGRTTTAARAKGEIRYLEDVELTARRAKTHIGIIRDPGHDQPWIVAMSEKPGYLTTLDYSGRWGIEPMFSDFKSRGFGVENTQIQYPDRLARLLLVMALALYSAVSTGLWDEAYHVTPAEAGSVVSQFEIRGAWTPASAPRPMTAIGRAVTGSTALESHSHARTYVVQKTHSDRFEGVLDESDGTVRDNL